jgi:hypothetical protein
MTEENALREMTGRRLSVRVPSVIPSGARNPAQSFALEGHAVSAGAHGALRADRRVRQCASHPGRGSEVEECSTEGTS